MSDVQALLTEAREFLSSDSGQVYDVVLVRRLADALEAALQPVDVDALADVIRVADSDYTSILAEYNPDRADAGWPPPDREYYLAAAVVEWMEKQ